MWEAVWGGCQPQPSCNDIILTTQVIQIPNSEANFAGIMI